MQGETLTGLPAMRYQSENFILDTDDYSLTRNGVKHPIEPQVFDLLVYLIENKNRVVTRDELLEQLWGGRIVSDSAINASLKEARKAVGDTGRQQRIIKTIHRRGYQFIAEVVMTSNEVQEDKPPGAQQASQSEKPSLAVLKFNNLSNDPEQEYFSDGMATNICSRLSRIRSLQVKSGILYDLAETSLADVALKLEVKYVLSGSVQRDADRVRVFVELTEGSSADIRWSESFDRRGKDVIDIQDDIAQAITATLWSNRGTIREAERDKLSKKPTSDFNAFDYILKGISYKEQYKVETIPLAHECFDKAIELDSDCAEAWGWKAWVYLCEVWLDGSRDTDESLSQALIAAKKSIAIDAYSEIGHWSLSEVYCYQGDNRRGLSELKKALEINPNNPDVMVSKGCLLCYAGQFDAGLELIQQGFELNKHFPQWYYWNLGTGHFAGQQWQDCIDAMIRMDEQNKDTLTFLAASYVLVENLAEARASFAELSGIDPDIDPDEIEKSHAYLPAETLQLMSDAIRLLIAGGRPQDRLKIVKS